MAYVRHGFFQKHFAKFNPLAPGFRECQVGAFCAVRAHFSILNEPCVVSLPTGSGKTALMMALCFGLKAERVLIINPAEVLRLQTKDKFGELDDLQTAGALTLNKATRPKVHSVESELRTAGDWNSLKSFDIVTATTRTTSPTLTQIARPPVDLFDLVFIDEGHHAAAVTWKALITAFQPKKTRIILLTGTPYRRDNKPIGAKTIYIYPIAQAIDDGIYAPVTLATAGNPSPGTRDEVLADLALKQLLQLRKQARGKPLLLAKTDRKTHADILGELYAKKGLTLGVVHSDQTDQRNRDAIDAAAAGQVDGLVVVGMLGEGLDIPALKVAVFHRNPQSLPYTLQVVGRLARAKGDLPNGIVVASSNDFSRDTFKLYEGSEDWLKLIPQLEQQLIDQIAPRYSEQIEATGAQIQIADIRPHFSVTAYQVNARLKKQTVKGSVFQTVRGDFTVVVDKDLPNGLRVFVTRALERPVWLRKHGASDVTDERFDVHTFYDGINGTLVRQSTDDTIAAAIQKTLCGEGSGVEAGKLNHLIASLGGDYLVLGLKNAAAVGGIQPTYKMLLGQAVHGAISNTDRTNCHAGHCFARKDDSTREKPEFRGVAYRRSRVWSLDRDNLNRLGEWMKVIGQAINLKGTSTLPELDGLRQPVELAEFPGQPVAILHSSALLVKDVAFIHPNKENVHGLPSWIPGNTTKQRLAASMPDLTVEISVSLDQGGLAFAENGRSGWQATVFPVNAASRTYPFEEFIREFPPVFVFADGSTWSDGVFTRPHQLPSLNDRILNPQVWKGCDIGKEIPDGSGDSVHDFVERAFVVPNKSLIALRDHTQGEMADYVTFNAATKLVSLYHCKGALKDGRTGIIKPPGVDQKTVEELVAQAMASCRWVRNDKIFEQLEQRLNKQIARFVSGARADFNRMAAEFDMPLWHYEIVLVQPGVDSAKVKSGGAVSRRIRGILAAAADYISGNGATMKLICS